MAVDKSPCTAPSLDEMLSDPLVKAVMKADGVELDALEAELRSIARMLSAMRDVDVRD